MIHFVVPAAQQGWILEYLDCWGRGLLGRMHALTYEELAGSARFERGTYVLSALDQLGPAMLRFLEALHCRLRDEDEVRFLNHPAATLGRLSLLSGLHRAGYNDFRAIPAGGDLASLRYPVFLRVERRHDGTLSPLLESPRQVESAIGRAVVRGYRARDLIVVEFCPTANVSGQYRKLSAFAVGDMVVPRCVFRGPDWMLKRDGELRTVESANDELDYVRRSPEEEAQLREIFTFAGVGYGRIDYGMKDGRVQTWEINLNPIIGRGRRARGRGSPDVQRIRLRAKAWFYRSFRAAWEAVDVDGSRPAVPLDLDADMVRAARLERQGTAAPAGRLAGVLEPMRPALERLAGSALPLVGRLARRRVTA